MDRIKAFQFGSFNSQALFCTKEELFPPGTSLFVADKNTAALVPGRENCPSVILNPGEEHKQLPGMEKILHKALDAGLARDSILCGAGGGVVTDMSALAASLYMRGCRLILIPTSLLAMVDAALGGKTGIDAGPYKNMIGTFYPAEEVRICPEVLTTLPQKEYLNGLGEVFKPAIIGDQHLLNLLKKERQAVLNKEPELLKEIIRRCVLVKGDIVEKDFKESGQRAFLNLGHTFGHALEAITSFSWAHGAAVVWGMGRALEASVKLGLAEAEWAKEVKTLFTDYGYTLDAHVSSDALLKAMDKDKKKRKGRLPFIIPAGPQDIRMEFLEPGFLREIL